MNKRKSFSVSIPEPCYERWSEMTPAEQGRFCHSCQHQVIDFTKMTDAQIVSYLSKQQGRVCGRMQNFQMNRNLLPPKVETITWWQKIVAFVVFVFSFGTIKAQEVTSHEPIIETVFSDLIPPVQKVDSSQMKQITIQGKIVDKTDKEPIYAARVVVVGSEAIALTNFDGQFLFTIERHVNDTSAITLHVRYLGQETRITISNPDEDVFIELDMVIIESMTVGIIIYAPVDFDFGTTIRFDRFGRRED